MPEGDTVWSAARRLGEALEGRQLTRTDFRVPRYATTDLTGRQVTQSLSRGKHLLTRVEGGVTVHTHLKMDGAWRVRPASERPAGGHRIRLVLGNDTWQAIGYQLGIVEVLPTEREDEVVGHLGPDLLGPDWDPDEAVRRLKASPDRPIGEALLDQRNLAGIGNVYKCEVLFLRGVQPWRPAGQIEDLAGAGRPGAPAAGREQEPDRAHHHRAPPARRRALGVRPGRPPVPPLRHRDQKGRPGPGPGGAGHLLVPQLPAVAASPDCQPRQRARQLPPQPPGP